MARCKHEHFYAWDRVCVQCGVYIPPDDCDNPGLIGAREIAADRRKSVMRGVKMPRRAGKIHIIRCGGAGEWMSADTFREELRSDINAYRNKLSRQEMREGLQEMIDSLGEEE